MEAERQERPGYPRGERVWLRPFDRDDIEAYLAGASSADTGIVAGYNGTLGRLQAERWFEKRPNEGHGNGAWYWVISPIGSREFLGTIWLWNGDSRLGGLELSIFILASAGHGKGLGTDAIRAALDFAFGTTDTERVWMFSKAANKVAHRAFEKAGFRHDGVIRHLARENGAWIDAVLMSILREEWEREDRPRSWDRIAEARAGEVAAT